MDTDEKYIELIEQGDFTDASSLRTGFSQNEEDLGAVFEKVWALRDRENWDEIDRYMGMEYLCDWLDYKASLGELSDRLIVFRNSSDGDLDDGNAPLDRIIRDKVASLIENTEITDLYDVLYLCRHRYSELAPDIKGLLRTYFEYCDPRHIDYILATQYVPSIDEDELRDLYRKSRELLGLR